MRCFAVVFAVVLSGCPKPPPPVDPMTFSRLSNCPATAPTSAGACGTFTVREHLACFRCEGASGCVDADAVVYCVVGGCDDARCALEPK